MLLAQIEFTEIFSLISVEKVSVIALLCILLWILFKKLETLESKRETERERYVNEIKEMKKEYDYKFEILTKDILTLKEDSTEALKDVTVAMRDINETNKELKKILDILMIKIEK